MGGHGWHINDGILQPLWISEEEELVLYQNIIESLLSENMDEDQDPEQDEEGIKINDESSSSFDSETHDDLDIW